MTSVPNLSIASELSLSDYVVVYSLAGGFTGKTTLSALLAFIEENYNTSVDKVTQYSAPSSTGFTVAVTDSVSSVWLVLTPTGAFAAGTIKLPAVANAVDRQEVLVNCTQAVTTLTVDGNGATVTGAPTTLSANGFFRMRFDAISDTWYRVG